MRRGSCSEAGADPSAQGGTHEGMIDLLGGRTRRALIITHSTEKRRLSDGPGDFVVALSVARRGRPPFRGLLECVRQFQEARLAASPTREAHAVGLRVG